MIMPQRKANKKLRINHGIIYILPWLIGYVLFRIYPFGSSLVHSFTDFSLFENEVNFIGLDNYNIIFNDEKILYSLGRTFVYVLLTVPMKLIFSLLIAYILSSGIRGIGIFRTIYYIPSILGSSVAVAVLWKAVFRNEGLINSLLEVFGINGPNWLGNEAGAMFSISLLRAWQFGSCMVLFLAALKNVPRELYEAAMIDGAGRIRRFYKITLPFITPVIFYNLITQLAEAFQEFNAPYIITGGGPRNSTTFFSLLIYKKAFTEKQMGLASAMAWVLFLILIFLTAIIFISSKKWVYYGDER